MSTFKRTGSSSRPIASKRHHIELALSPATKAGDTSPVGVAHGYDHSLLWLRDEQVPHLATHLIHLI